jgi:hypothetical protein
VKRLALADQLGESIGQLDFPAAARFGVAEMTEDLRLNDIAADDRQCRGCLGRIGFLDHPFRPNQHSVIGNDIEHTIA